MIPHRVHQTARIDELSWEERQLRRRLVRLLPGWDIRLWTDEDNRALVAQHFPRFLAHYDRITRGVVKADIARCIYMHAFGGVYLDTDYKLYRPLSSDLLAACCLLPIETAGFEDEKALRLGNAVLASEPGFPFWQDFIEHIFVANRPEDRSRPVVTVSGPYALTRFYLANRERYAGIVFPDIIAFHPNQLGIGPRGIHAEPRAHGVHLCWGSWRGKRSIRWLTNQVRRKLSAI